MITIYGCSDDLVEIGGDIEDEIGSDLVTIDIGWPEDGERARGVRVVMTYAPEGYGPVWGATVGQFDEGADIPWAVTIKHGPKKGYPNPRSYSAMVVVDCPPGTPVEIRPKRGSAVRYPQP